MSVANAIQKAVYDALRADATLAGLLAVASQGGAAVYDYVPQAAAPESAAGFPYVVIGEHTEIDFDADDFIGTEATLTLHVWSRKRGKKECNAIQGRLKELLHNQDQALTVAGHQLVLVLLEYAESFVDPYGVTRHGVSRFRFITIGG